MDSAASLRLLISGEQFTVAIAHNLRDARRQISLQQPDILLLDLRLPDGNGMDLLVDPNLVANSEVVLCTGHANLESSIQALRRGRRLPGQADRLEAVAGRAVNHHKERTAAVLGISLKTLYNRRKEYAAEAPSPAGAARAPPRRHT